LLAQFTVIDSFAGATGSSYLDLSPDGKYLYAIDKTMTEDRQSMLVTAFTRDPATNRLTYLNSQPSEGMGPCHVHCSQDGRYLFTSNYTSGNVAAFPLDDRGSILPASSVVESEGTGPVAERQEGPHTHYVTLDLEEKHLLSPDLGADRVLILQFDRETGNLSYSPDQPFFTLIPGSGPRHLVMHPEGIYLYVANELNSTVTACSYDPSRGLITELNSLSTVTASHEGSKYPAAIRISPDGRFVYVSTRGDISSIGVFRVESDGSLSRIQVVEDVPRWPRDFNIDPEGRFVMVAGERSHDLELYYRDDNTGMLTGSGVTLHIPSPGCILFIP
jgi:6-phosphogluconolactonase